MPGLLIIGVAVAGGVACVIGYYWIGCFMGGAFIGTIVGARVAFDAYMEHAIPVTQGKLNPPKQDELEKWKIVW